MADQKTRLSFETRLPNDALSWMGRIHDDLMYLAEAGYLPEDCHESDLTDDEIRELADHFGSHYGIRIEASPNDETPGEYDVWIRDIDGAANDGYVAELLHRTMVRFELPGAIGFEFATYSPSEALNTSGGGAYVVTRDDVESVETHQWIGERMAALEATIDESINPEA